MRFSQKKNTLLFLFFLFFVPLLFLVSVRSTFAVSGGDDTIAQSGFSLILSVEAREAEQVVQSPHNTFSILRSVVFSVSPALAHTFGPIQQKPFWFSFFAFSARPIVTLFFLFLFLGSLVYAAAVVRGHKHLWRLFWHHHAHVFHRVTARDKKGTYLHAYAHFHPHARVSKHLALASGIFLLLKVAVTAVVGSLFFRVPFPSKAIEQMTVIPGAVLTYKVTYNNSSQQSTNNFTVSETFPDGVSYIPGSATVNTGFVTDASDADAVVATEDDLTFTLGVLPSNTSGTLSWQVRVDSPAQKYSIPNTITYVLGSMPYESNEVLVDVYPLTLSGKLFYDVNGNGVLDTTTEATFNDVTVHLYLDANVNGVFDLSDALFSKQQTEVEGYYAFTGLPPGTYFVDVVENTLPQTTYKAESVSPLKVVLGAAESKSAQDIAFTQTLPPTLYGATVSGTVWHDINRNASWDKLAENPLADIEVRLYQGTYSDGIAKLTADTLVQKAFTDKRGVYTFPNLVVGEYVIEVVLESVPDAYMLTTKNLSYRFSITALGQQLTAPHFGFALPTSKIGDEVFEDTNNNTLHDSDEAGFSDAQVVLYEDRDHSETFDVKHDTLITTTATDTDGSYVFTNVPAGSYFVFFVEDDLPDAEYHLTTQTNPRFVRIDTDTDQQYLLADFGYRDMRAATTSAVPPSQEVTPSPTAPFQDALDVSDASATNVDASTVEHGDTPKAVAESDDALHVVPVSIYPDIKEYVETSLSSDPMAPILTRINHRSFSDTPIPSYGRSLLLEGFASPSSSVTIQVASDPTLTYVVKTNEEGHWVLVFDVLLLSSGQHVVYAQTKNDQGKSDVSQLVAFQVQFSSRNDIIVLIFMGVLLILSCFFLWYVFLRRARHS